MPRLMEKGSDIWSKSSEPVTDRHQLKFFIVSVPGTICTPHQIPCDSVQRRLLSIKMAVFMDGVCKNQLLSTKRVVFMDKM